MASVLGALDDRIALPRETNATLEAIAQALFKSWFVDFDPVRAKSQGLAPAGMDETTAALFPDGFDESALGLVPKGWEQINLAELTKRCGGSIQTGPFGSQLHASDYVESGVPVVMPKDIVNRRASTQSIARFDVADAHRLTRHQLRAGDIVFSRRGDVERHALITEREVGWLCGTGCLLLRPGSDWAAPGFLSMLLDASQARTWLVQHAVGATMPNLNTGILGSVPVLHADAAQPLQDFRRKVVKGSFGNFAELRAVFPALDKVGERFVFNIGGNKYRLVAAVDFLHRRVFIKAVLTHGAAGALLEWTVLPGRLLQVNVKVEPAQPAASMRRRDTGGSPR